MSSAAAMPSSCRGKYRRVALILLAEPTARPAMISTRARGVAQYGLIRTWEALSVGKTERSAFGRALAEATAEADKLATLAPWFGVRA